MQILESPDAPEQVKDAGDLALRRQIAAELKALDNDPTPEASRSRTMFRLLDYQIEALSQIKRVMFNALSSVGKQENRITNMEKEQAVFRDQIEKELARMQKSNDDKLAILNAQVNRLSEEYRAANKSIIDEVNGLRDDIAGIDRKMSKFVTVATVAVMTVAAVWATYKWVHAETNVRLVNTPSQTSP